MSAATATLEVLSAAPWFDDATAIQIIARSLPPGGDAQSEFNVLLRSGALVHRHGLWRVPDPLRSELRAKLHARDATLYAEVLGEFGRHAHNGMEAPLAAVLGRRGAAVTTEVVLYVAGVEPSGVRSGSSADAGDAVRRLHDMVNAHGGRGAARTAADIARLLQVYGVSRSRAADFFLGLSHWGRDERVQAVVFFEAVLRDGGGDLMAAIASHLVAVYQYGALGALDEARANARDAVDILRGLEDRRGLSLTLNTLGRIERERYRESGEESILDGAIAALEEARELASDEAVRARNLDYLARVYVERRRFDDAWVAAEEAVGMAPSGEEGVSARITLAFVGRESGRPEEFSRWVEDALYVAERDGVEGISLASALNMAAGTKRREGDYVAAEGLVRRSLALGRRLRDRRHTAHAAHTLAAVLVDSAISGRVVDLDEARRLLEESKRLLVQLRDPRGVGLVDSTISRLENLADATAEAGPEGPVGAG